MTQKICPRCRQDNALENDFCGGCGARLETALVSRPASPLVIGKGTRLPAPLVKQVVRAAATGLLALVAEAGVSWLRRRGSADPSPTVIRPAPLRKQEKQAPARGGVTVFSRRVVQVWERGHLRGEGVEESVWRWHEEV